MSESPAAEEERREDVNMGEEEERASGGRAQADLELSDDESELSEVNEEDFGDFDVNQIEIEQDIDADNLKAITRSKRERKDGEEPKKKKREGRKEKQLQKKSRRRRGEEDDEVTAEGGVVEGGRGRRRKAATAGGEDGGGERRSKPVRAETPDEQLSEGERRRRQLQKNVERILKKPKVRRRRAGGVDDLENPMEEEVQQLHDKMVDAARLDSEARKDDPPRPATHKLKMLPEVTAILNRTGREAENVLIDPEINLMETVKFFLEPLEDGSLPAYNIQRDIFAALMRLRMPKESLIASGIGKVILFYTKSKRPEQQIKLQAERLLAEWTRPILKRSDDYRKRMLQEVEYDPSRQGMKKRTGGGGGDVDRAAMQARAKAKALARPSNRARIENPEIKQYTIVPKSNLARR